jgi:hypothetical protein
VLSVAMASSAALASVGFSASGACVSLMVDSFDHPGTLWKTRVPADQRP